MGTTFNTPHSLVRIVQYPAQPEALCLGTRGRGWPSISRLRSDIVKMLAGVRKLFPSTTSRVPVPGSTSSLLYSASVRA